MKDANPGDEAFLNGVSSDPRAYSGFTRSLDDIVRQVEAGAASFRVHGADRLPFMAA